MWVDFLEINDHPSAACAILRPCAGFGLWLLARAQDAWLSLMNIIANISPMLHKSRDRLDTNGTSGVMEMAA
jgi:hypothetical protein